MSSSSGPTRAKRWPSETRSGVATGPVGSRVRVEVQGSFALGILLVVIGVGLVRSFLARSLCCRDGIRPTEAQP